MRRTARIVLCLLIVGAAVGIARPAAAVDTTVSVDSVSVVEEDGGIGGILFTVTVSGDRSGSVSVQYRTADVTATARTSGNCTSAFDYLEQFSGLSFSSSESSKTVLITTCGDTKDEIDETFSLQLHSPSSGLTIAGSPGTGTILDDDDPPRLTTTNVSATEGASGSANVTVPVELEQASGKTVTFDFATRAPASGAAATAGTTCGGGVDYLSRTGSRTITAGSTTPSQAVTVPVCGDGLDEANERFAVRLSNIVQAGAPSGDAIVTITDDDASSSLSVNNVTRSEGDTGSANARFTISLSAATGVPVSVSYATSSGTATSAVSTADTCDGEVIDHLRRSGSVSIPVGSTSAVVDVPVCGDLRDEPSETFNLDLSAASGATLSDSRGVATITDNDPTPTLSLSSSRVIDEGAGERNLTFLAVLSAESGRTVTFDFATGPTGTTPATAGPAGSTCSAGIDYIARSGSTTISPGGRFRAVNVRICGDGVAEADETFLFTIDDVVNASNAEDESLTTLRNDDGNAPPTADAGPDQQVASGAAITLDGGGSTDPEGLPLSYAWVQTGGPQAVLRNGNSEQAQVDGVRGPATLTFQLTVRDSTDQPDSDTVVVQVAAPK